MKILENKDSAYEWLKNIPSGECFKLIDNDLFYMKTQSITKDYELGSPDEVCSYGCVCLSDGKICYIEDRKVIPVHATVTINYNSSLKKEGVIDD